MPCSTHTLSAQQHAASPAVAVARLERAAVSRQPSSAISTSVRPSSSGLKVIVTVVL
jgi:hypothetical protein